MNTVGELKDIYEICRFVGMGGSTIDRFLGAAEQAGYVLVRKDAAPRAEVAPTELRFNEDGTLDEVVSSYCHLEQMDYNHWFLDAGTAAVWLHAKGKITATFERRPDERSPMNRERKEG